MRSKLAISILAIAALFGTTMTSSALPEGKAGADATINSNAKPGVTTGSATTRPHTHKGVLPNPSIQNERDSGSGRGK
jgi:hypothetical protein